MLTVEQRKRLGVLLCGDQAEPMQNNSFYECNYWRTLVTKIAEHLDKTPVHLRDSEHTEFDYRFITALATGNTEDLEQLCFELIEGKVNE